jgi:hypothetical protein
VTTFGDHGGAVGFTIPGVDYLQGLIIGYGANKTLGNWMILDIIDDLGVVSVSP